MIIHQTKEIDLETKLAKVRHMSNALNKRLMKEGHCFLAPNGLMVKHDSLRVYH
jgi:hypothetical protein